MAIPVFPYTWALQCRMYVLLTKDWPLLKLGALLLVWNETPRGALHHPGSTCGRVCVAAGWCSNLQRGWQRSVSRPRHRQQRHPVDLERRPATSMRAIVQRPRYKFSRHPPIALMPNGKGRLTYRVVHVVANARWLTTEDWSGDCVNSPVGLNRGRSRLCGLYARGLAPETLIVPGGASRGVAASGWRRHRGHAGGDGDRGGVAKAGRETR